MKKLIALAALMPAPALAHGFHAPVEPALHGFAHVLPGALVVIRLAAAVALIRRTRG